MSSTTDGSASGNGDTRKNYKGVRRRKWGKWVSEIRVPGTPERLWLGSYSTPEAAAVAHDVAFYCLRGNSSPQNLKFPPMLPASVRVGMSPRSVQKAASDAGLAIDARFVDSKKCGISKQDGKKVSCSEEEESWDGWQKRDEECLSISVEDYLQHARSSYGVGQ